jgi:transglutaminase-like putative cysteine protease
MSSNFDKIAAVLLGGVFGVRAFDVRRPLWARVAYGAVGYDFARAAWTPSAPPTLGYAKTPAVPLSTPGYNGPNTPNGKLAFASRRVNSIEQRVALVHQQMIHGTRDPQVYGLTRQVLAKRDAAGNWAIDEKDHASEVKAIFAEVRRRARYTWDPLDYDAFQTPRKTLELQAGDCDDLTSLLGAMLRSAGHQVRTRVVQTKGSDTWNHIYLVVKVGSGWMPLDPSVKYPPGWEVPEGHVIKKQDFIVVEK